MQGNGNKVADLSDEEIEAMRKKMDRAFTERFSGRFGGIGTGESKREGRFRVNRGQSTLHRVR